MHGHPPWCDDLAEIENISGTIREIGAGSKPGLGMSAAVAQPDEASMPGCAYIAAESWPPGAPPFCGAVTERGSPYCTEHRRLCTADPASEAGAMIAIAQDLGAREAPPLELARLAPIALPEPMDEEEKIAEGELPFAARHDHSTEEEA